MTRKEVIGAATLYLGDAREVLPTLERPATIISDPPYGMGWDADTSRFTGGVNANRRAKDNAPPAHGAAPIIGDNQPFDPRWMLPLADKVTIWGFNHLGRHLPVGSTLVWIKRNDGAYGSFLSDAELAWESGGHGVYCRRDTSMYAVAGDRVHPAQKPLGIMTWCIQRRKLPALATVADPYMGSGSTGVAALHAGKSFVGVEIDPAYFDIACRRIEQAQRQGQLFGDAA